ncbi:hypothetical protein B0A53_01035 [Rhodotorula sp. CCFEE 5036]|nr:hypothetical protein B0A53_01035 [Rhodotorula sp. CCFEE 5036]
MLPPLSRLMLVDGAYGEQLAASEAPRITTTLLVRVGAVIALIAALVVFVSRRILFPHQKRAPTLTEINTRLNRNENGGTGVVFRKWRSRLFPPPVFGDEDELAEAEREAELEQAEAAAARNKESQPNGDAAARDKWSYRSKPVPEGLRTGITPPPAKRVRIVEPELEELELLRELWSSPEMQAMTGSSGIGGFRRTRDFYSRSQGGSAVVKRPGASAGGAAATVAESGSLIPATKSDDDEGVPVVAGPLSSSKVKSVQRLRDSVQSTASPHLARPNSLSPAPIHRRHRTLSPTSASAAAGGRSGSPAFIVGSQSSAAKASPNRRRALSPGVASTSGARSGSPGGAAMDVTGPRWIKVRHLAAGPRNPQDSTSDSAAGAADSSEHETTDDDASADEVSDRLVPDAAAAAAATNGTATPPSSSLSSVLHTLTGMDALASALDAPSSDVETEGVVVTYSDDGQRIEVPIPSPATSVLSGGESPQESPTPGPHHHRPLPTKSAVAVHITPSSPPPRAATPLPPLSDEAPESPTSPSPLKNGVSAATAATEEASTLASKNDGSVSQSDTTRTASSTTSAASESSALSPSPCVAAQDRRLSLRVQQTLRDKRQKRHGSPVSIGSHGSSETVTSSPPVPLSA